MIALFMLGSCKNESSKVEVVTPDFTEHTMDLSVKPQDNFFKYVNGNWMKNNPLPDDKSRYGSFDKLREDNKEKLKKILAEVTKANAKKGTPEQMIADFYKSGMNIGEINKLGYSPIKSYLDQIDGISSKNDIVSAVAQMHDFDVSPLFYFFASADAKNSKVNIAQVYQGGLGLADNSYYSSNNKKHKEMLQKYEEQIVKMFVLIDVKEAEAKKMAKDIVELETKLAVVSMDKLERRDPNKTYNIKTIDELVKLAPNFNWKQYFTERNVTFAKLNVSQPNFFKGVSDLMAKLPIQQWKNYLKWNVLNSTASFLSEKLVAQNFEFYGKYLRGVKKDEPRWKRVLGQINSNIGELMGKIYVKKYFPPQAKAEMIDLVNNLKEAFYQRVEKLDWMSTETKAKAIEKLNAFGVKIGYPDKWRKYEGLNITSKSYLDNILAAKRVDVRFNMNKIDKPVDPTEWSMNPQTVNAYYHPLKNEIVFPAAILQPPFFYLGADKAVNYGAIGVVIGHEMTHGFDDKGSMFDKNGNLSQWWTKEDKEKFEKKTKVLVDQFDKIIVIDDMHANGKFTLGENIADNGGLNISLDAFRLAEKKSDKKIDGFTPTQRYFLSYARIWAQNIRDKEIIRLTNEDVHSLGNNRVNAQVVHVDEFYNEFGIKDGDKMFVPSNERAKIW
jgi:putative endopeptidase